MRGCLILMRASLTSFGVEAAKSWMDNAGGLWRKCQPRAMARRVAQMTNGPRIALRIKFPTPMLTELGTKLENPLSLSAATTTADTDNAAEGFKAAAAAE